MTAKVLVTLAVAVPIEKWGEAAMRDAETALRRKALADHPGKRLTDQFDRVMYLRWDGHENPETGEPNGLVFCTQTYADFVRLELDALVVG